MRNLILALLLTGCATAPQDVVAVQQTINATPNIPHNSTTDDWQGLANFKGGNCYQKSWAKCAMLWGGPHECRVVLGCLENGQGHAVALVDGKYWLDQRKAYAPFYSKPDDFTQATSCRPVGSQ